MGKFQLSSPITPGSMVIFPALGLLGPLQEAAQTGDRPENIPTKTSRLAEKLERELQARTQRPIKQLDIDLIMLGPDFSGTDPSEVRWAGDNSKLWFQWKRPGEKKAGVYEVLRTGGEPRRFTKEEERNVPSSSAQRDKSGRWAVYAFAGDIHRLKSDLQGLTFADASCGSSL